MDFIGPWSVIGFVILLAFNPPRSKRSVTIYVALLGPVAWLCLFLGWLKMKMEE